jgi:hypothetical protein
MRPDEEALGRELGGFPTPQINAFISAVRRIVALYDIAPPPQKRSERREQLERLKRTTFTYLGQLLESVEGGSDMSDRQQGIGRMAQLLEEAGGDLNRVKQNREAQQLVEAQEFSRALEAGETTVEAFAEALRVRSRQEQSPLSAACSGVSDAISLFLDQLEQELEKPIPIESGRPAADAGGLLTQVAYAYERLLHQTPTSTKHGTFYNIAVIVTGQEAPDRSVQAAIRKIVNPQNPPSR